MGTRGVPTGRRRVPGAGAFSGDGGRAADADERYSLVRVLVLGSVSLLRGVLQSYIYVLVHRTPASHGNKQAPTWWPALTSTGWRLKHDRCPVQVGSLRFMCCLCCCLWAPGEGGGLRVPDGDLRGCACTLAGTSILGTRGRSIVSAATSLMSARTWYVLPSMPNGMAMTRHLTSLTLPLSRPPSLPPPSLALHIWPASPVNIPHAVRHLSLPSAHPLRRTRAKR